ncbi:VMP1 family protein [Megaselia abdita]
MVLLQRLGVKSKKSSQPDQQLVGNNLAKMELTKRKDKKATAATTTTTATKSNSTSRKNLAKLRAERDNLVIWRSPFKTLNYCSKEILTLVQIYGKKVLRQRAILSLILVLVVILGIFYHIPGRHQVLIEVIKRHTWFCTYWVGLGVLSSVGLGTGLHTFLLYLGPHIASVTLAAYECNSLNFPKPPYPDDIICPDVPDTRFPPNLWNIMTKVRLEAFLWGAGTALGELPPYFMAKAARLSGTIYDEEDVFEDKGKSNSSGDESSSIMEKGKVFMEKVVEKIGFFGILACASIPNPLFDLAGITCGHFLIPFWTFFGATLIGKAIIKMHIQKIFIIIAFNEALIEKAVDYLIFVPVVGKRLQQPFKSFLENQKQRLHNRKNAKSADGSGNIISKIFEIFVIGMVLYFIISIVNSFAQSYHKRLYQQKEKEKKSAGVQNNHQQNNSKTKAN